MTLLILTYTPLGIEVKGNRNWLDVGLPSFRIQPAEFAKLAMIVWGRICWRASAGCSISPSICSCPTFRCAAC